MDFVKALFACALVAAVSATSIYIPPSYDYCPPRKVFEFCPTACPIHCDNKDNPPKFCIDICRPGVRCVCRKGFIETNAENSDCIRPSQCPDKCKYVRCGQNEKCVDGKCVCIEGYERIGKKCVGKCPERKIFMSCPTACPDNCDNIDDEGPRICPAVCRINQCVCRKGYIEKSDSDTTCVRPYECPGRCKKDSDCKKYQECKKGKCVCKTGYDKVGDDCLDSCRRIFCGPNTVCIAGQCICKKGFKKVDGKCVPICPKPKVYDACSTACPINCMNYKNPPTRCTKNCRPDTQCVCPKGLIEMNDENFKCVPPKQCDSLCNHVKCGANQECIYGKCVCREGYEKVGKKCVDKCHRIDCKEGRICVKGQCKCPKGYDDVDGKCVDICYRIRILCKPNSSCKGGKCVCNKGYIEIKKKCVDACIATTCPRGKICDKGECVCPEGYIESGNKCVDACIATTCPVGSICKKGQCQCREGYTLVGGKCVDRCKLMYCPGRCYKGKCINLCGGRICPPGSTCIGGRCRCRPVNGYYPDGCFPY